MSGTLEGTRIDPGHGVGALLRRSVLALVSSPFDVLRYLTSQAEAVAP